MNIQHQTTKAPKSHNMLLLEVFNRHKSVETFLLEAGNSEDNRDLFEQLSLFESFDPNKVFSFENGIFIPGLGSRAKGRLSLNALAESSDDCESFIKVVNEQIAQEKLGFELTEKDISNLTESYMNRDMQV